MCSVAGGGQEVVQVNCSWLFAHRFLEAKPISKEALEGKLLERNLK
jgi:hypothetical protein